MRKRKQTRWHWALKSEIQYLEDIPLKFDSYSIKDLRLCFDPMLRTLLFCDLEGEFYGHLNPKA